MSIRKLLFLVFAVLIGLSAQAQKQLRLPIPPNMVIVQDNFYADITEVTNLDYREFVYWTAKIFGYTSTKYTSILPDTTVWTTGTDSNCKTCVTDYFRNSKYNDYPVIGISYEQAVSYSHWRSDRVYELLLADKG